MSQNCGIVFSTFLIAPHFCFRINASETMSTSLPSISVAPPARVSSLTLFRQPGQPRRLRAFQNRIKPKKTGVFEPPRLFSSPHSDRVAILNQNTGTYCAYSLQESVNKTGLTREDAEDWVKGQLLFCQHVTPGHSRQALVMILASWGIAALGLWGLLRLMF